MDLLSVCFWWRKFKGILTSHMQIDADWERLQHSILMRADADSKFRDLHISDLNQRNKSNLSWTKTWQASAHCASAQPQHGCHWGSASDVQRRRLLSADQPPHLATISANTNHHSIYLHPMHLLSHWSAMSDMSSKRNKLILQHATHKKINECETKKQTIQPSCRPINSVIALKGESGHHEMQKKQLAQVIFPLSCVTVRPFSCHNTPAHWLPGSPHATNLSLRFNGHFPGEPGLASVYWSKGWWRWLWQLDYRSCKSCKAPVKSSPPTNQHPVFLQAGCPSCRPTNSVKALKGISRNQSVHRNLQLAVLT